MPVTHDAGRLYATHMRYLTRKGMPLLERGWSNEIEHPFRRGRCLVLRIPFTKFGIVMGLWGRPGDEDTRLQDAAGMRLLGPLDPNKPGLFPAKLDNDAAEHA